MGRCCCTVGCSNRFYTGCVLHFYPFPVDTGEEAGTDGIRTGYVAVISSVGGGQNDDPTPSAYVSTLFNYMKSPAKGKAEHQLARYNRLSCKCV